MAAFSTMRMRYLEAAVDKCFLRFLATLPDPDLTPDDIRRMVLAPETIDRLDKLEGEMNVFGLGGVPTARNYYNITIDGHNIHAQFPIDHMQGLFPSSQAYSSTVYEGPKCGEVRRWLDARTRLGKQFGALKAYIKVLNEKVNNPMQYVWFFNGAVTLLAMNGETEHMAHRHAEMRRPTSSCPAVSPELRQAGLDFTSLLARVKLISEDPLPPVPVKLSIGAGHLHASYEVDWSVNRVRAM